MCTCIDQVCLNKLFNNAISGARLRKLRNDTVNHRESKVGKEL